MNKAPANHHKTHKPRQWRTSACPPRAAAPLLGPCRGTVAAGSTERGESGARHRTAWTRGGAFPPVRESLNWTLRRYVRALSLRVSLRRQAPEAASAATRAPVPAGRVGPFRAGFLSTGSARVTARAATTGETSPPAPVEQVDGVSLSTHHALRYRIHRNRQMEHFTQVAASLRGGVRRDSAITPRERPAPWDLGLTTLSSMTGVESNIFGFVMT